MTKRTLPSRVIVGLMTFGVSALLVGRSFGQAAPPPAPADPKPPAVQPSAPAPSVKVNVTPQKTLSGPVKPEDMKGVDWTGVTEEQKKVAMEVMQAERCDCSCGMTIAVCRRDDSTCGRSSQLAAQVILLAKQGKTRDDIAKTLTSGQAHKFVAFDVPAGDAPAVGPADAKVKILYYLDYQCPFCIRLGATLDELVKVYPNDVRIVFKQHPLPMHSQAMVASQAAVAAHRQGKFLEMHKELNAKTRELSREKVIEIAKGLGLDEAKFLKDLDSPEVKAVVEKEAKEVETLGASATPACFLNGRYVSGAKPLEFWKPMVEEELKWAKDGNRPQFTIGKSVRDAQPPQTAQQRGPDANKVYDLKVGKAPAVGAEKPTVTILHYLDYQ